MTEHKADALIAITGATILDGTGGAPREDGVILIRGERILRIGDRWTNVPSGTTVIRAEGKYIIPGLMDANVHLVLDYFPLTLVRYEGRYDELAIEAAQIALRGGVTTVFDSWGPREPLIKARSAVNSGRSTAARIFLAGNIVGFGGPLSNDFFPTGRDSLFDEFSDGIDAQWQESVGPELLWMPPEKVRSRVRAHVENGIDFVKFGVTGHRSNVAQYLQFSPRVQQVIVEEAHRAGKIAQTHTTSVEGLALAIEAGVDLLQHPNVTGPETIPEDTLDRLVERKVPCAVLAHTAKAIAWYRERGAQARKNAAHFRLHEIADVNDRALLKAGATFVLATDSGVFSPNTLGSAAWKTAVPPEESLFLLGEGHFNWLLAMEQKGMRPMDALLAATRNIARAYRVETDLGTLQAGKIADLVILEADPLQSAANYRRIAGVMKAGQMVDREALPTQRLLSVSS